MMEARRQAALERLHAAAAEAEGRIAQGPNRSGLSAPKPSAPATPAKREAPASAMDRLRVAMAEAEAKLLANGKKREAPKRGRKDRSRSRSGSPGRRALASPSGRGDAAAPPAGEEGDAAPVEEAAPAAPALPPAAEAALEQLRKALADADARINDGDGKHWLGAHEPKWRPGFEWKPREPEHAPRGLHAHKQWPIVEKMRLAADAAAEGVADAASSAVHNASVAPKYWNDTHQRLQLRFQTPPALRPQFWAHSPDLELPAPGARRFLGKKQIPLAPPPPPPRERSQSAGRISLAFSSPAKNQYSVSLSVGATLAPAGGAMSDAPVSVGTSGTLSWTHVRALLPQCVRETPAMQAAPADAFVDVATPRLSEKGHQMFPRFAAPGKAEAEAAANPEPAAAKEPYAPAALRPRPELALPAEADEAPSTSARAKPQRGPHIVKKKARKLAPMEAALPPMGMEEPAPLLPPSAALGMAAPRPLSKPPPLEDDACEPLPDGPLVFPSQTPAEEERRDFMAPHEAAPAAPPAPLCAQAEEPAPARAQVEDRFPQREELGNPRGAAKRWRRRAQRQRIKVTLTRWQAACVIQAHFRGMTARRLISAVKARILLSTHLTEKAVLGKTLGLEEGAMAPSALRHVKVLSEFYEKSTNGKRFTEAREVAETLTRSRSGSGKNGVALLPAQPNPLLEIYKTRGEAAALEAAAREALTWTNWMVPDVAKEAEDDATLAAVRAFKDMLREGENPADTRLFADRIALKAAAEVVGPSFAELTHAGVNGEGYVSSNVTFANRIRDGKPDDLDMARARKVPTIAHDEATTKHFAEEFSRMKAVMPRGQAKPARVADVPALKPARATAFSTPNSTAQVPFVKAGTPAAMAAANKAAAEAARKRSPPVSAAVPAPVEVEAAKPAAPVAAAAGKPAAAKTRGERGWFDSAASLFGRSGLSQQAAVTRIQAAVRGMRARRQLAILKARVELRAAVAAVRDKGIAAQPAVLDRTMALGDAYLRAWNLPRAEQCYTHVLETMERDYGRGDVRCVRPATALARVYRERGEAARADDVMRRATNKSPSPKPSPQQQQAAAPAKDIFGGLFGGGAPAAPSLDSAAAGVQDALASSSKALQGAADGLAGALGFGWLSSQPKPAATA